MPEILIHKVGLLTTIQDGGRYGFQAFGVPVSGAMDQKSLGIANYLVGNKEDEACLEMTLSGPEIEFSSETFIALTGAEMTVLLNWRPVNMYETIHIHAGDILRFGELVRGVRLYMSIRNGFDVPEVMDSKSTYLRGSFGGFKGRALRIGDRIPFFSSSNFDEISISEDEQLQNNDKAMNIRFIAGPEVNFFEHSSLAAFVGSKYTVSQECDRMGIRLDGAVIKQKEGADIVSSPVSSGTVQVAGDGRPIVLMADAQTTGGYTRIAQVISADIHLLAQMMPGDQLKFTEVTLDQA